MSRPTPTPASSSRQRQDRHHHTHHHTSAPKAGVKLPTKSTTTLATIDTTRSSPAIGPLRPRVHIRYGRRDDGKLNFMYAPIVQTLVIGFNASGSIVTVESVAASTAAAGAFSTAMANLNARDTFIWVGPKQHYYPPWTRMRANGVFTVYYQTEPLTAGSGCMLPPLRRQATPRPGSKSLMHELWDYSVFNLRQCQPHAASLSMRLRHVPPGFIGRAAAHSSRVGHDASGGWQPSISRPLQMPPSSPRAFFLGDVTLEERMACFAPLRQLVTPVNSIWDERALAALVNNRTPAVFLNLHKRCTQDERTQPLESVRLSHLLSTGGLVVSQRSHLADEAPYSSLVTFAPRAALMAEIASLLRHPNLAELARRRSELFRQRFHPEMIVARAIARPFSLS